MIWLVGILIIGVKFCPYFFDSPTLYFVGNDFIIILLLVSMIKKKTYTYFLIALLVAFLSYFIAAELLGSDKAFHAPPILFIAFLFCFIFYFRGRYSFDKLKAGVYDPNKVQIYIKKPKGLYALIGSFMYGCPCGSIAYLHGGYKYSYSRKTKRFTKKRFDVKNINGKIQNTQLHKQILDNKIGTKYNVFTNNCRSIFPNFKTYLQWT